MSALATFVMKGRAQAILVTVVASLIPLMFWVSGAVVSLVTMRRGLSEGSLILLFSLIVPGVWAFDFGEPTPFLVIVLSWLMALVLRNSISWDRTLLFGAGATLLLAYLLPMWNGALIDQLVALGTEVISQVNPDYLAALGENSQSVVRGIMIGSICVSLLMFALIALSLGRSWQAKLYNPGGFREEFLGLRLSVQSCFLLLLAMGLASATGVMAIETILIAMVPLSYAGLALVHGIVAKKNLSKGWLVAFYVAAFVLGPSLMLLVVILAFADALIDFRGRLQA